MVAGWGAAGESPPLHGHGAGGCCCSLQIAAHSLCLSQPEQEGDVFIMITAFWSRGGFMTALRNGNQKSSVSRTPTARTQLLLQLSTLHIFKVLACLVLGVKESRANRRHVHAEVRKDVHDWRICFGGICLFVCFVLNEVQSYVKVKTCT